MSPSQELPLVPEVFPLKTERLVLRRFERRDLPAFIAYRNHPEVARYQSWSSFSPEEAEAFLAEQQALAFDVDETWLQIAVEHRQDGVLLGDVAVHVFDQRRQAEIGMTFDIRHQGRGYAREAVSRVVELLFNEGAKHRIVAITDALNLRAHHLLEALHFRREAHHRENIVFKGQWSDEYVHALLSREWLALQG